MLNLKTTSWLKKQKKNNKLKVNIIKLSNLDKWNFNEKEITHTSGKFFKIVGLKVYSNFFKKNWDQPIIIQKEIGILGIIKSKNKYLLQAKVEPGNKNKIPARKFFADPIIASAGFPPLVINPVNLLNAFAFSSRINCHPKIAIDIKYNKNHQP